MSNGDKKVLGPGDLLPPTVNTIAGPTESRSKCNETRVVFKSAFKADRDFSITILNLGDCPIGAQIYSGVTDDKLVIVGSSGKAQKDASTGLAGTVPADGGFTVVCEGNGTATCRYYWRVDKM